MEIDSADCACVERERAQRIEEDSDGGGTDKADVTTDTAPDSNRLSRQPYIAPIDIRPYLRRPPCIQKETIGSRKKLAPASSLVNLRRQASTMDVGRVVNGDYGLFQRSIIHPTSPQFTRAQNPMDENMRARTMAAKEFIKPLERQLDDRS